MYTNSGICGQSCILLFALVLYGPLSNEATRDQTEGKQDQTEGVGELVNYN